MYDFDHKSAKMNEKAIEEDMMLPSTTTNEKIVVSKYQEDELSGGKTEQILRYLITTVLCVSYLCLVCHHGNGFHTLDLIMLQKMFCNIYQHIKCLVVNKNQLHKNVKCCQLTICLWISKFDVFYTQTEENVLKLS